MRKSNSNLSIKKKVAIIAISTIIIVSGIAIFASRKLNNETQAVSASSKNLLLDEEVVPEVKEEVIVVAKDQTIDESLKEEVTFDGMTVEVPKSKVAPRKSAEDPENNKKRGGAEVSQADTAAMFENTGVKSYGIDVSSYQGNINWAAVRASGIDFAMIRCGFRGYGTGEIKEDACFKQNVNGATANGVKVGIYFYSAAINEQEALQEASWVVQKIATYRITYPVVFDFEEINKHRCAGVDGAQAARNALTFLNYIQSNGYEPMIYANKSDIAKMNRGNFSCKFWLAHYTTGGQPTDYTGSHHMWQYTSEGSVPGISGRVDMNVAYFSYGATANAKHTHNFTELVRGTLKDSTCTEKGSKTMRCSCGETQVETIPLKDHTFGEWIVFKEATETEEGIMKRECSVCHKEETKTIDKLKPNVDNSTNTQKPTEPEEKPHEHVWTEKSRKEATCTQAGSVEYSCECGETKTETIEPTGQHKYNPENGICSDCGAKDPSYQETTASQGASNGLE